MGRGYNARHRAALYPFFMIRSAQKACSLLQAAFWISYCLSFGFLVAFLTQNGCSKSLIGVFIAVLAVSAIVAQPIYGYLSDKHIDVKKILLVCISVAVVAVFLIPFVFHSTLLMILLCIIIGCAEYGLASVIDCWCLMLAQTEKLHYGKARAAGSFAYGITAALFGFVFARVPMEFTFYFHALAGIFLLIIIAKARGVPPNANKLEKEQEAQLDEPGEKKLSGKSALHALLSDSRYVIFVICAAMTFIGSAATGSFLFNLLELRGGTSEHLGYALCVQAFAELPAMVLSAWLLRRFNIRFLLLFAFFAYMAKFLVPALATTGWGIVFAMALQGLSFAVFLPAAMKYLAIISPEGYKSTGTTLAVAVYSGIGNICGNLFGGAIADSMGVEWVFYFSSILATAAAILFLIFGKGKKTEML